MTTNNSEKTLIVFDTNKLQNTLDGEYDYSIFDPKGDIKKLKEFILKNNLQDKILIGFSDIVLREYCNHRKTDFQTKIDQFKQMCSKIKNLENCDINNIKFPEDTFDYAEYLYKKILLAISEINNNFIIIPLEEEKHSETFKKILDRAINHKKPFDERGDKGFKDTLIFESLIHFQIKNTFSNVILFSKDSDFSNELRDEFSKYTGKLLDMESNYELLEQTLLDVYHLIIDYPELLNYLKTEYFRDELRERLDMKDLEVINCCAGIEDCIHEDLDSLGIQDYLGESIPDDFKKVYFEFRSENKEYEGTMIHDVLNNETISVNYQEKIGVQTI